LRIPISEQTKQEVIAKWLSGWSRDKIAGELSIGAGTVSNIVNLWISDVGKPTEEALRMLSVEIRRHGMSVRECARGFRLLRHLQGLEADDEIKQIDIFLSKIYDKSKYYNLPPDRLVEIASEIWERCKIMPISEILPHLDRKIKEKENLDTEIKRLDAEKNLMHVEHNRLLHINKTTAEQLKQYTSAGQYFKKYGLNIADLSRLAILLQNAENYRFDLDQIVEKISRNQSLTNEELEIKQKILQEQQELKSAQDTKQWVENEVSQNLAKIKYCSDLELLGFGMNEFTILKSILLEISEAESDRDLGSGCDPDNVVKLFFRKIDEMRNLETKIESLRKEADRMEELFKSYVDSIKELTGQTRKDIKEISVMVNETIKLAYQKSRDDGVSDDTGQNVG
jgi:hypothetical protein